MSDNPFADHLDTNQYFLSLPKFVQENIKQAGPTYARRKTCAKSPKT